MLVVVVKMGEIFILIALSLIMSSVRERAPNNQFFSLVNGNENGF